MTNRDDTATTDAAPIGGGAAATGDAQPIPITLVPADELDESLNALPPEQMAWARANGFAGRIGQWLALPGAGGTIARVLVGWGTQAARARERFHLGAFARTAPAGTYRLETALTVLDTEEAALGWLLGRYRFDRYKPHDGVDDAELMTPEGLDGPRLGAIAEGVFIARDLINTPANDMSPATLEEAVRRLAERHGAAFRSLVGDDLLAQNLPLIHTVGRAAATPPRLIELNWGDEAAPAVTLVGKGVCFDTGGLNLKPGSAMALMKKDMGGAANVLGLAHIIMTRGLGIRLRVLIPAVENAVSGASMRPGDILTSRKGLTVEVNNTDAEGRLVLADALALADEAAPEMIIDLATLTGAARVALGPDLVPYYTDDEALARDLAFASDDARDPIWRLPLWPAYEGEIEPAVADLDNAPSGGMAGSITAALFLRRFVDRAAWAHFDIYGWTPKARPGRPKGGEAQAIRAIFAMLEDRYAKREASSASGPAEPPDEETS